MPGGRPRKANKRGHVISIRLTQTEFRNVAANARTVGESLSEFARLCLTGNWHSLLGERVALKQEVAAYRDALEGYTRARAPLNWATTQVELGRSLTLLGEREAGTASLEQAVKANRQVLRERTRKLTPPEWADAQHNLALALSLLGQRQAGTARLKQAVIACRRALKERTRELAPRDYASTQNNLGIALALLGEREVGTARLEQAVIAFDAALEALIAAGESSAVTLSRIRSNRRSTRASLARRLAARPSSSRSYRVGIGHAQNPRREL